MTDKIFDAIKENKNIIIVRHQNPDPDAIGSQVGLKLIIQKSFPDKSVFAVGADLPVLNWISKMDTVSQKQYLNSLVIAVDTANTERIDADEAYQKSPAIIKIDHHPNVEAFAPISWVDESYSSCAEMIYELSQEHSELKVDKDSATCLYAGIIGDTNRFLYAETSAKTLLVASQLAKLGVDISGISQHENGMSLEVARLKAYILENFTLNDNGFAHVLIDKNTFDIFGLEPGEIDNAVPLIGQINDVRTWAFISESQKDEYRVNLRSKDIAINGVAEKFGGGGHPLASGVYVHGMERLNCLLDTMQQLTD